MTASPSTTPAFKEWQVIISALCAGAQTIILRKGGIAEARGGFRAGADRFWLFPTAFHAQVAKTKPAAARFFEDAAPPAPTQVVLSAFAELQEHRFLTDWAEVGRLDPLHVWTTETVRERFEWAKPPGVHVLVVRVHRLLTPVALPVTPALAGCKSWVELPLAFADHPAAPVLGEASFARLRPNWAATGAG